MKDRYFEAKEIILSLTWSEHQKHPEFAKAIHYLMTWSFNSFDKVEIYNTGNDLNAAYENTETGRKYFIAGIWHKDEQNYSFTHKEVCMKKTPLHSVVVGNIGEVYNGCVYHLAKEAFYDYKHKSEDGYGRAGGEPVTWFIDGDIHKEVVGTNNEE